MFARFLRVVCFLLRVFLSFWGDFFLDFCVLPQENVRLGQKMLQNRPHFSPYYGFLPWPDSPSSPAGVAAQGSLGSFGRRGPRTRVAVRGAAGAPRSGGGAAACLVEGRLGERVYGCRWEANLPLIDHKSGGYRLGVDIIASVIVTVIGCTVLPQLVYTRNNLRKAASVTAWLV